MDPNKEQMVAAADLAAAVKTAVADIAAPAIAEALKPYIEKSKGLGDYAEALIELERHKLELATPVAEKGLKFARLTRALALGKGDSERAAFEAARHWGADDYAVKTMKSWHDAQKASLTSSSQASAGSLIPPAVSAEFIELLRGKARVRSISRVLPMPYGNLQIRKQTAAASASYVAESANSSPNNQSFGWLNLSFRKLTAMTAISNSLLRFGNPEVDRLVRDDLLAVMALKEDAAFLAGNGFANMPTGIFNQINSGNTAADAGTTFANQIGDYTKMIKTIEEADVPFEEEDGFWIMAPRVFWGIFKTTGSTEDATLPFKPGLELPEPRLLGYRVLKTTQAKKAYAGGDATETTLANTADRIYLVHAPSSLIGDSLNLQVDSFDGGAYYDGSSVVSGVSRDETVVRVISEHDYALRFDQAAYVLTGVSVGS